MFVYSPFSFFERTIAYRRGVSAFYLCFSMLEDKKEDKGKTLWLFEDFERKGRVNKENTIKMGGIHSCV